MTSLTLLGVPICTDSFQQSIDQVAAWALDKKKSHTVSFSTAHMLALAGELPAFRGVLQRMDMNCADGRPLVWAGRFLEHCKTITQVAGPDFMPAFCRETAPLGLRHYFLGAGPNVALEAAGALAQAIPGLQIAGCFDPPFEPISSAQIAAQCAVINASAADVVWVSLGCPKQELWLAEARHLLPGKVLLAVGQAFDIVSGRKPRAPKLMRIAGLEWLFRLLLEPSRLIKRYAVYNSVFLLNLGRYHVLRWKIPCKVEQHSADVSSVLPTAALESR